MTNILIFFICWVLVLYISFFLELKIVADFQARMGPTRVGFAGVWAPFASFSRMLLSAQERKWRSEDFNYLATSFFLVFSAACSPLLGDSFFLGNEIGIPVCLMSFLMAVIFFSKIRSQGIFKFLNHAQFLTGLLVVSTVILALGIENASLSWSARSEKLLFERYALIIGYVVFLAGGFLLLFETPFLSATDENRGPGYRKLLFEIYRRSLLLYWIVFSTLVFFGGLRQGIDLSVGEYLRDLILTFAWSIALFLVLVWFSQSQVPLRTDQSTRLAIRYFFPISVAVLILSVVLRFK